jgi:predicted esterase/catechol 2,3-dioxygenase-like lactoylglutathione lyase family enzyme
LSVAAVTGIHHVTAIASDPQKNLDFYAGVLGLRLVKRTVNFDDPQTYHFYFGDRTGTPGSLLTFFPWPGARAGRQGPGQVAVTSFAIEPRATGFWVERLLRHGIRYDGPAQQVISFRDPDGLLLELVAAAGATGAAWGGAPGIARENAIQGLHSVTLWVDESRESKRVLVETLGFRKAGEDGTTQRFVVGDGGPGRIVGLRAVGGFPPGAGGAGTVHHVAWRVEHDAAQLEVRAQVIGAGLAPTPVIDRQYFHSVYFREPGGVLFELATEQPGFAIDEPVEHLGGRLALPPQFEARRAEIERVLPPVHLPGTHAAPPVGERAPIGFVHRYVPPPAGSASANGTTLLLLHGTGGDEESLIPLGRALLPGAGLLSPRGNVLERGAPRFFRRVAEGVFDLEDLARRSDELADFIAAAAARYGLDPDRIVAVGFSNGANIAASVLLRRPGALGAAVLLSPVVPFEPDARPNLAGTAVLIGAGKADAIALPDQAERLAALLRGAGADVTLHWEPGGHAVTEPEVAAARAWLAGDRHGARKTSSRSSHSPSHPGQ